MATKTSAVESFRSYWDGANRAPIRWGIGIVSLIEYAAHAFSTAVHSHQEIYSQDGWLTRIFDPIPWISVVLVGIIAWGLWGFVRAKNTTRSLIIALSGAFVVMLWQQQVHDSPARNGYVPGIALLGWLVGTLWLQAAHKANGLKPPGIAAKERAAEAGVVALIAALYVNSAFSKITRGGLDWANAEQVRSLVLWQEPMIPGRLTDWATNLILGNRDLASAIGWYTLIAEGGAFMLLSSPRARALWATLILMMHVGIISLTNLLYLEPMVFLLIIAFPWPRVFKSLKLEDPTADATLVREPDPKVVWISMVVFLVVMILVSPWGWFPAT